MARRNLLNPPIGEKFGDLTVAGFHGRDINSHAIWLFRCKCERSVLKRATSVLAGRSTRCRYCAAESINPPGMLPVHTERDAEFASKFVGGKSFRAIATEHGVSRNTVIGTIWRARKKGLLPYRSKVEVAA